MKKKRTICIKDPKLCKIRDNFRDLWLAWGSKLWTQLHDKYVKIHYDRNRRPRHPNEYSEEEKENVKQLKAKMNELQNFESASICMCTVCNKGDRDMTFNPVDGEWYCAECYDENKDFYKETENSFLYP